MFGEQPEMLLLAIQKNGLALINPADKVKITTSTLFSHNVIILPFRNIVSLVSAGGVERYICTCVYNYIDRYVQMRYSDHSTWWLFSGLLQQVLRSRIFPIFT